MNNKFKCGDRIVYDYRHSGTVVAVVDSPDYVWNYLIEFDQTNHLDIQIQDRHRTFREPDMLKIVEETNKPAEGTP